MGIQAREIQAKHLKSLPANKRLFPINAGMGWVGNIARKTEREIIIMNPRPLHAAPVGWPDLCGWETVEITQEMVGRKIAIFCAEEIKAGGDRLTEPQKKFRHTLESMGGIYRIITGSELPAGSLEK